MPHDEHIIPYGCLECASIVPYVEDGQTCPRCGSTEVLAMDEVLYKLISYETFMQDMGIETLTDND